MIFYSNACVTKFVTNLIKNYGEQLNIQHEIRCNFFSVIKCTKAYEVTLTIHFVDPFFLQGFDLIYVLSSSKPLEPLS